MAIQVTLSANQFNHSGTYNGRNYTSLQVNYTSRGRIYFSIVRDGIRWCEMAKQIKLEEGIAFVSFGKNDKLIVGTYTDDTIQEVIEEPVKETIEDTTEENTVTDQSNEPTQVDKVTPIKLNKQKEKVMLKGYMSKGFEGYDGQQFKYKDLDFYLVKSSSGWCIIEKITKLYAVTWRKQRKIVFAEFEQFMSQRYEKVKENIDKKKAEVS